MSLSEKYACGLPILAFSEFYNIMPVITAGRQLSFIKNSNYE